jgi:hypothetical protein
MSSWRTVAQMERALKAERAAAAETRRMDYYG